MHEKTSVPAVINELYTFLKQADARELNDIFRDLDAARKAAMAEFKQYVATVATSVAEQIIRRSLNAADQQDLVNRSLEQLQEIGR
jgi:F0F1-type ATP synthase membrane subunit b/b'